MSKLDQYIHPITMEAAKEVASNIREDDRKELEEGHGVTPYDYLTWELREEYAYTSRCLTAGIAGMASVEPDG